MKRRKADRKISPMYSENHQRDERSDCSFACSVGKISCSEFSLLQRNSDTAPLTRWKRELKWWKYCAGFYHQKVFQCEMSNFPSQGVREFPLTSWCLEGTSQHLFSLSRNLINVWKFVWNPLILNKFLSLPFFSKFPPFSTILYSYNQPTTSWKTMQKLTFYLFKDENNQLLNKFDIFLNLWTFKFCFYYFTIYDGIDLLLKPKRRTLVGLESKY